MRAHQLGQVFAARMVCMRQEHDGDMMATIFCHPVLLLEAKYAS
jgi:hypothetical protein